LCFIIKENAPRKKEVFEMYIERVLSEENYKGFELVMLGSIYGDNMTMHRSCRILKDGVALGQAKTKKELKDLIDSGIYN
jgi:hypothetical protein